MSTYAKWILSVVVVALMQAMSASAADKPIARWVFDAAHVAKGVVRPAAGGLDGRINGRTRLIRSRTPNALILDGRTESITVTEDIAAAPKPRRAMTLSAWVAIDKPLEWGGIISLLQDNGGFEKGWLLGYRQSSFTFGLSTVGADDGDGRLTYLSAKSEFEPGRWYHVAGTYDGAVQRIFVNGRLESWSKVQRGDVLYPPTAMLEIGAYRDDDEFFRLEGLLHDVSIYDSALSEPEIAEQYNEKAAAFAKWHSHDDQLPDPLRRWVFDEPGWLRLDGETTSIEVSITFEEALLPRTALTAEAWVAIDRAQPWGGIFSALQDNGGFEKGWLLGIRENRFCFGLSSTGADDGDGVLTYLSSTAAFEPGRWYYVVATFDGLVQRLFVDGELESSTREQFDEINYPVKGFIEIGAYRDDNEHYRIKGRIAEVSIYDRALTPDQIRQKYQAGYRRFPQPLRAAVGPYVQPITPDRYRVVWDTKQPMPTEMEYGFAERLDRRAGSDAQTTHHSVVIQIVERDAPVSYRLILTDESGRRQPTPIYSFDPTFNYTVAPIADAPSPFSPDPRTALAEQFVKRIIAETGIRQGYALVVGCVDGRLAYELARSTEMKVVAIDEDRQRVRALRLALDRAGIYGARVSVHHGSLEKLPYGDYFANLIVSERALFESELPGSAVETLRKMRPSGGAAYLLPAAGAAPIAARVIDAWLAGTDSLPSISVERRAGGVVARRGPLPGAGSWTHMYADAANTASSGDTLIRGSEMQVQWWGRPGPRPMLDRGARNPAPLYANGRLFIQGDRQLIAVDAYNGTIYWTLQIPALRRTNMPRDCSNMVIDDQRLYAAVGDKCLVFEARTGRRVATFALPSLENDREYEWGFLARSGDLLLGSHVRRGSAYTGAEGEWYDGTGADSQKVTSDALFARRADNGEDVWRHNGGTIVNSTLTIGGQRVYFLESRNPRIAARRTGRLGDELRTEQFIVSLALDSGRKLWEKEVSFGDFERVAFLSYADETLVVVGTSNRYQLHALDARDGRELWRAEHKWSRDHHGGALRHPVLTGGVVYAETHAYDLRTGRVLRTDIPQGRGCGTVSASATNLFFRHHFHSMWNTENGKFTEWHGARGGCWLGIIPAGGVVLAPETSSGCSCTHPIQTSVAFVPR